MQTKKYPLGSKVEVSEHRILIVGSGELKVSMALPSEKKKVESELFLCTKKPGDIVNIAATKKNASARMKHAKLADYFADVEITTCTETVVLILQKKQLEALAAAEPALYDAIQPLMVHSIADYLRQLSFLEGLAESKITVLGEMCQYAVHDEGEVVVREGTKADTFYIVLDGRLEVCLEDSLFGRSNSFQLQRSFSHYGGNVLSQHFSALDSSPAAPPPAQQGPPQSAGTGGPLLSGGASPRAGEPGPGDLTHLASLGPGSYFGETALLMNIPRTTTVRAATKCLVLTIPKAPFQSFLTVCPELRAAMTRGMVTRLLPKLRLLQIPVLRPFDALSLARLVDHSEVHLVQKGDTVCLQGEPRAALFIVIYGDVQTLCAPEDGGGGGGGRRPTKTRWKPGQVLGAESFHTQRQAATVQALQEGVLLELRASMADELVEPEDRALFNLLVHRDHAGVADVVCCPEANAVFRRFLVLEHNHENIDFVNAVSEYIENYHVSYSTNYDKVRAIHTQYVSDKAVQQVNIKASMRTNIEDAMKEMGDGEEGKEGEQKRLPPDVGIFDEAFTEIMKLMGHDALPRFKKSNFWKTFLHDLTNDEVVQKRMNTSSHADKRGSGAGKPGSRPGSARRPLSGRRRGSSSRLGHLLLRSASSKAGLQNGQEEEVKAPDSTRLKADDETIGAELVAARTTV